MLRLMSLLFRVLRTLLATSSSKRRLPAFRSLFPTPAGQKRWVADPRPLRRYPIGAELIGANEIHFRIWAPKAKHVDVVLEESAEKNAKRTFHPLQTEDGGYFSASVQAGADTRYRFRVDNAEHFHPDPASRFQSDGPHGSSCVIDPKT